MIRIPRKAPDEREVLSYWFPPGIHDTDAETYTRQWLRWFAGGPEAEREISARFGGLFEKASRGELDSWADTPRGRLALIIVLDQFSRAIHKDTPLAYANDPKSLRLSREGVEAGMDRDMELAERLFFAMPLAHAEGSGHLERMDMAVRIAGELVEIAPPRLRPMYEFSLWQAKGHRDVIRRFGRHPHRNEILARPSTPEEIEYLENETPIHKRRPRDKDAEKR